MDTESPTKTPKQELADKLTQIACLQLQTSNNYKKPLLEKWKQYEDLKAGNVKKKLRIQFSVALPVFTGMLDTLAADFDEPVELEFQKKHPSDYSKVQKIQASFDQEKKSLERTARWDYKSRIDKSINIMYGRSILKEYAESDPKYRNVLQVVHPTYFHCQPMGGGLLEDHLFCGEEGILRTESEIEDGAESGIYDKAQVKELKVKAGNKDYIQNVTDYQREKLARFQASGLDPDNHSYVGETTYNLCEWVLTHKGERYYLLFDPWTITWIRCEKLKDIFSKNLFPWTSWASFEDDKIFWSQSYADIIYPVADSIVTLFNQELTNREKSNMGARAYDKDMFPDVAKLDEAQYRADALVPVDTKGGTRQIANGLYRFDTAQLQGTIELLDWTNKSLQQQSGISDISQGTAQNAAKKVNVAYMEQASVAKRLGYKSQSYTECWGEIGVRYVQGLKDHMSQKMYIEILGDTGIEPDVMTREDVMLKGEIGVNVVSSTARKASAEKDRQAHADAIKLLIQDQNMNSEWRTAATLRYVGKFKEDEIKLALDTRNYASKESVAKAHIVIEELLADKDPLINYAADTIFLKIIMDYMMEHRNKLGKEKFKKFALYITANTKIAMQNGKTKGAQRGMQNARTQMAQNGPQPQQGQQQPAPQQGQQTQGQGQPVRPGQPMPMQQPSQPEQMQ